MSDYVPLILIGGLAVGGFILWKQGAFNNLFTPPAPSPAPTPVPASGSSSTSTTTPSSCMGTDILSGQPCPCPSANVAYAYPGYRRYPEPTFPPSGPRRIVVLPGQFPGSFPPIIPGTSSTTCDCSRCGQSSVLGGISPSQFSTNGGDLNNFVGQAIAQAGYRI